MLCVICVTDDIRAVLSHGMLIRWCFPASPALPKPLPSAVARRLFMLSFWADDAVLAAMAVGCIDALCREEVNSIC